MSGNENIETTEVDVEVKTDEVETTETKEIVAPTDGEGTKELIDKVEGEENTEGDEDKKDTEPADKGEEGEDKDPSDKPSADIVFAEDSTLTEEQQSEMRNIFGTQEKYDQAVTLLQSIGSEETAKVEAARQAQEAEWETSLKKDPVFGLKHEENMALVKEFTAERSEEFRNAVDLKNPAVVKELHSLAKERSDAEMFVSSKEKKTDGIQRDMSGKPQFTFDKTLGELNNKK